MKRSAMLIGNPPARRGAFRLLGLALVLLTLALALPAGAAAIASPGVTVIPPATIASFAPDEGPVGTVVTVTGSGFTGATRVTLGRAEAAFTVLSDAQIWLTVPAGARSGSISVTTPGGQRHSAGSFTVIAPAFLIVVTAPTGTGSYAQGSSLTVSWGNSTDVAYGEFGLGVRSAAGDWSIGKLVPASGAANYTTSLTVDVPVGSGYKAEVAWRPVVGSGPWDVFATSPGSFVVTASSAAKAITAFSFQGLTPPVTGVINEAAHTIALTVPPAADVHALVATFTTTGAAVAVGGTPQVSGTTANDFSSPVTYRVTATDASTQDYVVTVRGLAIGDAYGGGVVAYILQSGDPGYSATVVHGLIAAKADQRARIAWISGRGVLGTRNGNTSTALGTGQANTNAMMAQAGSTGGAAWVCHGYTNADTGTGVYSDWYLPSQDELNKLYINRVAIGGFTGADPYYWSSSEMRFGSDGATNAWGQSFINGFQFNDLKSHTIRARAVRSF